MGVDTGGLNHAGRRSERDQERRSAGGRHPRRRVASMSRTATPCWSRPARAPGSASKTQAYVAAGAKIAPTAAEIFARADMIVKVKEPQPQEWAQLHKGQILFTYLHLAADAEQARGLMQSGVTAVAYETVTDDARRPAAPRPDERGRRTPVDPGGGDGAAEAQWRARRPPRRRPRRPAGQGHRDRRRRGRHRSGADGGRRRRRGHRPRQVAAPAPRPRRHVPRPHPHPLLDPRCGRRGGLLGRRRDRRGADPRRRGPEARHPRHAHADEAGLGAGRRRHRPGRLLRDLASDHPCRADLHRRRRRPLLRRQHAGRRAAHLERGAQQRHPPLRPDARRLTGSRRSPGTSTSGTASTSTTARSPIRPSPRPSASPSPKQTSPRKPPILPEREVRNGPAGNGGPFC